MKWRVLALAMMFSLGFYAWTEGARASENEELSYVDPDGESIDAPPAPRTVRGCRIPDNGDQSSPVKVYVDQASQTIRVEVHGENDTVLEAREGKVTTGGGLKIPNGKIPRNPYCAVTPQKLHHIIRAIRPEDFGRDSGCTPEQIVAHSTVFDLYHSNTFTDVAGNPAPMAHAIRVEGGVFFHTAGREYQVLLGTQNLSGGCIRLDPDMALWLKRQIIEHGAIDVTISEKPEILDPRDRRYCDRAMERAALIARNEKRLNGQYYTGTEGIYEGGRKGMEDLMKGFGQFGGTVIQGVKNVITSPFQLLRPGR